MANELLNLFVFVVSCVPGQRAHVLLVLVSRFWNKLTNYLTDSSFTAAGVEQGEGRASARPKVS